MRDCVQATEVIEQLKSSSCIEAFGPHRLDEPLLVRDTVRRLGQVTPCSFERCLLRLHFFDSNAAESRSTADG